MAGFLKQSTAVTLQIGPFLDATDGVTVENGLTIAQADVKLQKADAVQASKNDATSATYDADGYYRVPLNATDTNTLGHLRVIVDDSSTHLPVWHDYVVLAANVYDSLIGGGDTLDVNATQWAGSATAANDTALATAPTNFSALAIAAADGRVEANVEEFGGTDGSFTAGVPDINLVQWRGTQPAALSNTYVQSSAQEIATGLITAAAVAADAIDASALAADAVAEIVADIMTEVVESEGSYTVQQALSIMLAVLAGETSSGGDTIATPNGNATRVAATTNASNERTAMTLTPSS